VTQSLAASTADDDPSGAAGGPADGTCKVRVPNLNEAPRWVPAIYRTQSRSDVGNPE